MKRKFVINPRAGRGGPMGRLEELRAYFEQTPGGFDCVLPTSREGTIEQTRRALHDGYEQIVAVGGDGTVNAVVNGFFEQGAPIRVGACLSVADGGTGCDYARAVYGDDVHDWRACVETFEVRHVDLGRVTFEGPAAASRPPLYFANMASVGLSADVVERKQRMPRFLPGSLAYAVPAFAALFTMQPFAARIELDGVVHEGDVLNLFAAKGVTAGGGMRLGGHVAMDDGAFDVTIIKGMGLLRSLPRFARLFTGQFDDVDCFVKTKASRIGISSPTRAPVELDGELEGTTDVEISVVPRALALAMPVVRGATAARAE